MIGGNKNIEFTTSNEPLPPALCSKLHFMTMIVIELPYKYRKLSFSEV